VLVDASHGNSEKKHENQPRVTAEVGRQIAAGSRNLLGVMIESHIIAGQQELKPGRPLTCVHRLRNDRACAHGPCVRRNDTKTTHQPWLSPQASLMASLLAKDSCAI
jgi:3-deoxy-D-arabino-heptulosonate 7-phosphate (DAHP) synthase